MDFTAWTVDLSKRTATHVCGFQLQVEGDPKDPNAVHPGKFPPNLSNIDKVRLVRTGMEAMVKAARSRNRSSDGNRKPTTTYTAPPNRPKRNTLRLKK